MKLCSGLSRSFREARNSTYTANLNVASCVIGMDVAERVFQKLERKIEFHAGGFETIPKQISRCLQKPELRIKR